TDVDGRHDVAADRHSPPQEAERRHRRRAYGRESGNRLTAFGDNDRGSRPLDLVHEIEAGRLELGGRDLRRNRVAMLRDHVDDYITQADEARSKRSADS